MTKERSQRGSVLYRNIQSPNPRLRVLVVEAVGQHLCAGKNLCCGLSEEILCLLQCVLIVAFVQVGISQGHACHIDVYLQFVATAVYLVKNGEILNRVKQVLFHSQIHILCRRTRSTQEGVFAGVVFRIDRYRQLRMDVYLINGLAEEALQSRVCPSAHGQQLRIIVAVGVLLICHSLGSICICFRNTRRLQSIDTLIAKADDVVIVTPKIGATTIGLHLLIAYKPTIALRLHSDIAAEYIGC